MLTLSNSKFTFVVAIMKYAFGLWLTLASIPMSPQGYVRLTSYKCIGGLGSTAVLTVVGLKCFIIILILNFACLSVTFVSIALAYW
jgi:hypothetical protein